MANSRETHAPNSLRLLTLGGLSLVDAAGSAVIPQRRRLALLALLTSGRDQGVSRDRLIALLSPESTSESARHSLHQLLYYLRQQAGEGLILGTDSLRLNPLAVSVDRTDFETALARGDRVKAVDLYRGPFLDAFHLNSVPFDEWVDSERSRLATVYSETLFQLAREADGEGAQEAAIGWWRRLAVLDPLSGRVALGLMRALATAGDAPDALRHARVYQALTESELGGHGDPQVRAFAAHLTAAIRSPAPEASHVAEQTATLPPAPPELAGSVPPTWRPRSEQHSWRWSRVAGAVGLAILFGTGIGFFRRAAPDPSATADLAILPFRITAADSTVDWLREGIVELLAVRLAGAQAGNGAPIRIADPARSVRAWARADSAGGGGGNDLPGRVAAELGATRIIQGSITATAGRVVLTAWIRSGGGSRVAQARADGSSDSVVVLVDRLAVQLLGIGAGIDGPRLESLARAALPTVRLYLKGRAAWRTGRAEASMELFRAALDQDTTFALAGLGLMRALLAVEPEEAQFERVRGLVVAHQDQLVRVDRALLDLSKLRWENAAELFTTANAAVVTHPTAPDLWYALGEAYYRFGTLAGLDSTLLRASDALRQGRQLDSLDAANALFAGSPPPVAQPTLSLVELAQIRGDTAGVRRLTAGVVAADSSSDLAALVRWHRAVTDGIPARRAFLANLAVISQYSLGYIGVFVAFTGIAAEDAAALRAEGDRRRRLLDPGRVGYRALVLALNDGRPSEAARGPLFPSRYPRGGIRSRVHEALSWDGDTTTALQAIGELRPFAEAPAGSGPSAEPQLYDLCTVARWRASRGDFTAAQAASRRLRGATVSGLPAHQTGWFLRTASLCAALLDAERATGLGLPDARERLQLADSLARLNIFEVSSRAEASVSDANLLLVRLWERHGDHGRALRAARRWSGQLMRRPHYQTSFFREEGRLAALTGDTAGAIRAYQKYLALRTDPEPSIQPQVDRIRSELGKLRGEPRHR